MPKFKNTHQIIQISKMNWRAAVQYHEKAMQFNIDFGNKRLHRIRLLMSELSKMFGTAFECIYTDAISKNFYQERF